ncbi:putative lipid II flippase FtsW, partial [Jatrophihabitans sp.]|uniref:putative lipid II flippase FtsW n=1 Tax=Jatrophihabitans sp. TaxID=1932789 RepID=UPI0030C77B0C|nr:Cell division-specific peptidoglycan biosynthesis regulator FtsW [Jatrophihabitans sp.]
MSALPALADRAQAVRSRLTRADTGDRFLDRPYASVQLLLVSAAGLLVFGVLMAVSTTIAASTDPADGGSTSIWTQVIKEGIFIVIGLPIFWSAMVLPPKAFRVLAYPFMILGFMSLLAVLIPGIGFGVYGARRWIDLGPLQLQPSEFAKIGVLLWGADLLARKQQLGTLRKARHLFIPLVPGFLLIAGLVMLEPDLGTTCCYLLILLGLLWMVGMPMRYFAVMVGLVAGGVTLLALAAPYRWQRVTSFLHPFSHAKTTTYHAAEGIYALASGGIFGVGLGQGTSKYGWVPNANSDFVFAIIGEELGLLGCLAVLALFAMFAFSGMRIARRSADPFVRLVAGAATVWICGQAVINVGYVTALLPVTGIPLPFISAGGTSLLATFFVLGMLVSFARHEAPAVVAARRQERFGRRSRLERWLRIPVPKPYAPPKR